jgi:hypothetical protein
VADIGLASALLPLSRVRPWLTAGLIVLLAPTIREPAHAQPQGSDTHFGETLRQLQEVTVALERLARGRQREVALASAYLHLAVAQLEAGDRTSARRSLLEAVRADPGLLIDPDVYAAPVVALAEDVRAELAATVMPTQAGPCCGSLAVSADLWMEVAVDGARGWQTPVTIRCLPPGRYRVRVGRPSYEGRSFVVEVRKGETTRLLVPTTATDRPVRTW